MEIRRSDSVRDARPDDFTADILANGGKGARNIEEEASATPSIKGYEYQRNSAGEKKREERKEHR